MPTNKQNKVKTCNGPDCDASVNEGGFSAVRLGDKLFCCYGCGQAWLLEQGIFVVEERPASRALTKVNGS